MVRRIALACLMFCALSGRVHAQGKTDIVILANGDRITGEVKRLERGRLEFSTDDAGTLYLEWDKLLSVVARTRLVEVVTGDGRRFLGTLGPTVAARSIAVAGLDGVVTLALAEVTVLTPIGRSFWKKLDGSIDTGFSYTRSSGVAQLNLNWATVYRQPNLEWHLTMSGTQTHKDDETGRDDRGSIEASYLRYPWPRWFLVGGAGLETNESLGLEVRSRLYAAAGPRVINSNRARMTFGAGLGVNNERGVDVEPTDNVEALLLFRTSFYTYDRPKTNLDISLEYYPSLTDSGRQRVQFDAAVKREFWKDLFVSLNGFNTYDSRPPNPAAAKNDVGIVWSIGWSY
jgi:hypothetical protein